MSGSLQQVAGRAPARRGQGALVVAIVLAAVNLRTAVTSVGPVLDELEQGIGLSSGLAGVLTTLPVLAFAALGALTPRFARHLGERRSLALGLVLMTVGLAVRATVDSAWLFLLVSVVALAGGAIGNVLLPVLVKRHFPDRIGPLTAAYTTALAVGTTTSAGLTVPVASLRGEADWRLGLGIWALPAAAGAACWLVLGARAGPPAPQTGVETRLRVTGSRTAWALALFFGSQSMQAYIAFGWFALFFREQAGVSAATAGVLLAFLAALSIPTSMVIPSLAARWPNQRPVVVGLVACYAVAYTGMLAAPRAGAWLWVLLTGVAAGAFPLALTLIGLRARTPGGTASLSAFAQSVGYVLAGSGPLLVGVLHGRTHSWTLPFVLLFADLVVMLVAGWYVAVPRYVEDELGQAR